MGGTTRRSWALTALAMAAPMPARGRDRGAWPSRVGFAQLVRDETLRCGLVATRAGIRPQ